jgi:hypothetical protein
MDSISEHGALDFEFGETDVDALEASCYPGPALHAPQRPREIERQAPPAPIAVHHVTMSPSVNFGIELPVLDLGGVKFPLKPIAIAGAVGGFVGGVFFGPIGIRLGALIGALAAGAYVAGATTGAAVVESANRVGAANALLSPKA